MRPRHAAGTTETRIVTRACLCGSCEKLVITTPHNPYNPPLGRSCMNHVGSGQAGLHAGRVMPRLFGDRGPDVPSVPRARCLSHGKRAAPDGAAGRAVPHPTVTAQDRGEQGAALPLHLSAKGKAAACGSRALLAWCGSRSDVIALAAAGAGVPVRRKATAARDPFFKMSSRILVCTECASRARCAEEARRHASDRIAPVPARAPTGREKRRSYQAGWCRARRGTAGRAPANQRARALSHYPCFGAVRTADSYGGQGTC